jgi:hypothetical protein
MALLLSLIYPITQPLVVCWRLQVDVYGIIKNSSSGYRWIFSLFISFARHYK